MNLMPSKIKPMLAYPAKPFNSEKHIFELKFDGTRCIAFIKNKEVKLQNRRLLDITKRYPELKKIYNEVDAKEAILDGEIVVLSKGRPDFNKLQYREHAQDEFRIRILSEKMPAFYIIFDILYLNGKDLTKEKLIKRKEILRKIISREKRIIVSEYIFEKGKKFYEQAIAKGFEGIMAKHIESPYIIGERSKFWLKIKKSKTIDCVICGYTEGEGTRKDYFGSLVLGCILSKEPLTLHHLGQVGTGFSEDMLKFLKERLEKIKTESLRFKAKPEIQREVTWVLPRYVCEVEFLELTKDKKLRAPVFKRLRDDKAPEECSCYEIIS